MVLRLAAPFAAALRTAPDLAAALRGAAPLPRLEAALGLLLRLLAAADFAGNLLDAFAGDLRALVAAVGRLVVVLSLVFKVGILGRNGEAAACIV